VCEIEHRKRTIKNRQSQGINVSFLLAVLSLTHIPTPPVEGGDVGSWRGNLSCARGDNDKHTDGVYI